MEESSKKARRQDYIREKYPDKIFHKKCPKSTAAIKKKRAKWNQERFKELCLAHGLNPWDMDKDSGEWRELCIAIINRLLPCFQINMSGRKPQDMEHYREIAKYHEAVSEFFEKKKTKEVDNIVIKNLNKKSKGTKKLTPSMIKYSRKKHKNDQEANPEVFEPDFDEII